MSSASDPPGIMAGVSTSATEGTHQQGQPQSQIPPHQDLESEYFSFDYTDPGSANSNANAWKVINLCISVLCCLLSIVAFMIFVPIVALAFFLFFLLLLVLICCGQNHPQIRMMALARQARMKVKHQPRIFPTNQSASTANATGNTIDPVLSLLQGDKDMVILRDWTTASGMYHADVAGALDLTFLQRQGKLSLIIPGSNNKKDNNNQKNGNTTTNNNPYYNKIQILSGRFHHKPLWNVSGKSSDGMFILLEGLLAENGRLYWLERHNSDGRLVLVQGSLDYTTFTVRNATWTDTRGLTGSYATLERVMPQIVMTVNNNNAAAGFITSAPSDEGATSAVASEGVII